MIKMGSSFLGQSSNQFQNLKIQKKKKKPQVKLFYLVFYSMVGQKLAF